MCVPSFLMLTPQHQDDRDTGTERAEGMHSLLMHEKCECEF